MNSSKYVTKLNLSAANLWKKTQPILTWLDIELTERCNLNCIHCYINQPQTDYYAIKNELSTKDFKSIIKEAVSLGCMGVRFTGGEPLLRSDFEELYLFTRKLGLSVQIFTNATLINSRIAKVFLRTPPLQKIEITLYGMTKESYESVSQKVGSFASAWDGINLLLRYKIPFVVKYMLLPSNIDQLESFEKWSLKIPWMEKPADIGMFYYFRAHRDSSAKNRLINKLRISPKEGVNILTRNEKYYLKWKREFCTKFLARPGIDLFSCGAGVNSCCLNAYGYLQLCPLLRHPETLYDLKQDSLKYAITHFFPRIRKLTASDKHYLDRCARCFLRGLCQQCPAKSWMEHGVLDKPLDYFCSIAHLEAHYLGLIHNDEKGWQIDNWEERINRLK